MDARTMDSSQDSTAEIPESDKQPRDVHTNKTSPNVDFLPDDIASSGEDHDSVNVHLSGPETRSRRSPPDNSKVVEQDVVSIHMGYPEADEPEVAPKSTDPVSVNRKAGTEPSGLKSPRNRAGVAAQPPRRQPAVQQAAGVGEPPASWDSSARKPKKSHARKQPKGHIPRPRNAFILFRKHITDNNLIPTTVEVKHQNVSVIASKMWAEAPPEVKAEFVEAARLEKEEHALKYPNYRYQPAYRRTDIVRRRVRKDPIEEEKCEAVAALLMEGKVGKRLETEIKQVIAEKVAADPGRVELAPLATKRGRRRKDTPGELSKGAIRAARAKARAQALRDTWVESTIFAAGQVQHNAALAAAEEAERIHYMQQQHAHAEMEQYHREQMGYIGDDAFDQYRAYPEYAEDLYNQRYANQEAVGNSTMHHQPPIQYSGQYGMVYEQEVVPLQHPSNIGGIVPHSPHGQTMFDGQAQALDPRLHQRPRGPAVAVAPPLSFPLVLDPIPQQSQTVLYSPTLQLPEVGWDGQAHRMPLNNPYGVPERLVTPLQPTFEQTQMLALHQHEMPHRLPQFQDQREYEQQEYVAAGSRPSDIIAEQWAEIAAPRSAAPLSARRVAGEGELLPFLEVDNAASNDIDFGDKGELFGGLLGGGGDKADGGREGLEEYRAAVKQQEEMQLGLRRI